MHQNTNIKSVQVVSSLTKEFQGLSTAVGTWSRGLGRLEDDVQVVSTALPVGSPPADVLPAIHTELPPSIFSGVWAAHSRHAKRALAPLIRAADVVHVHGMWHHPGYVAAKLAAKYKKPLVVSPHGELMPVALNIHSTRKSAYLRFLMRKVLSTAAGFHALTLQEETAISMKFPDARITMVPNGIEPISTPLPNASSIADDIWPSLVGRTVILFMGRIHHIKGIDLLLNSLKLAIEKNQNIRLLIAGSDFGAETDLKRLSRDLNIQNYVVWAGHLDGKKKEAALGRCDIYVLPSKSDVVGLATLEAMQAGLPVIITEECGGEIIAEEGAGIIVSSNPIPMADAIVQLANEHDFATELGAQGKRTVARHFDTEVSSTNLKSFYDSIIN